MLRLIEHLFLSHINFNKQSIKLQSQAKSIKIEAFEKNLYIYISVTTRSIILNIPKKCSDLYIYIYIYIYIFLVKDREARKDAITGNEQIE